MRTWHPICYFKGFCLRKSPETEGLSGQLWPWWLSRTISLDTNISRDTKQVTYWAYLWQTESCKQGWRTGRDLSTYPRPHHQRRQKNLQARCFREAKPYNYIIGALCVLLPASKKGIPSKLVGGGGCGGTYKKGLAQATLRKLHCIPLPPLLPASPNPANSLQLLRGDPVVTLRAASPCTFKAPRVE